MGYRNLIFAESLPGNVREHGDTAAVVSGKLYAVENDTWVEKEIGTVPGVSWPVGSVIAIFGEKDPSDLLGFGRWDVIKKEEAGSGVMYYWTRLE